MIRKSSRLKRIQLTAITIMIVAGIINYLDRATLSIGNTTISGEFGFSATQMGYLLSAFSLTYAFAQIPIGPLLDRFGARLVIGGGLFFWSLAQLGAGFVRTFPQFFGARFVLGVGESPMFTGGAKVIAEWYGVGDRGRAMGIFNTASAWGTAISPILLTWLLLSYGWRWMFIIVGIAGLVVAVIWYTMHRNRNEVQLTQEEEDHLNENAPVASGPKTKVTFAEYLRLFRSTSTWGIMIGFMGEIYVIWMFMTWLPALLQKQYHITIFQTGWLVAIPSLFAVAGTICSGFIADALFKRGYPLITSRKSLVALALLLAAIFTYPAAHAPNATVAVIFICLAQFFAQFATGASWILVTSIIPSRQTSSLASLQNFSGYLAGTAAPIVAGHIFDSTGSFTGALVITSIVALVTGIAHFILVRGPINTSEEPTPAVNQ
jgi:sugar phosphate permease